MNIPDSSKHVYLNRIDIDFNFVERSSLIIIENIGLFNILSLKIELIIPQYQMLIDVKLYEK